MNVWQAGLLATAWALGGMTALALAMDRHYTQWKAADEVPVATRRWLRLCGAVLLAAVWWPAVTGWSVTMSSIFVLSFWSLGALLTVAGLALSPRWLARLATAAASLGGGASLWLLAR